MIDRKKLPDFMQDMPEERLRELMEKDNQPKRMEFDDAMDMVLRKSKGKQKNGTTTSINKRK